MAADGNNSVILEILQSKKLHEQSNKQLSAQVNKLETMIDKFLDTNASSARTQTDFKYKICCRNELNYTDEYVKTVKFKISRYGKHEHILEFNKHVTEPEAIKKVEDYLSKPITREYFDLVTDDTVDLDWSFDYYKGLCRGKLLFGAFFLDCIDKLSDNAISLSVGS